MSNIIQENGIVGTKYAEPYAGGGGLALKLLYNGFAGCVYINDMDRSIYSFWRAVTLFNDDLCEWILDVDISTDEWQVQKDIQSRKSSVDLWSLAKSTFYLNRTNVSGIIKGGIIGGVRQEGKYKINARFNKADLIRRISKIKKFSDRIFVSCQDGSEFLGRDEVRGSDTFVYLDPPYYQKGSDLYMNYFNDEDHLALSRSVGGLRNRWIMTYDRCEYIEKLYFKYDMMSHSLSQSTSNRTGSELIIMPSNLEFQNSISKLNNAVPVKAPFALP